jgi:hypothetical protein
MLAWGCGAGIHVGLLPNGWSQCHLTVLLHVSGTCAHGTDFHGMDCPIVLISTDTSITEVRAVER